MKTVAFLSDFGEIDGFVAVVKGNILRLSNKDINFIDISHNIEPQNILRGSFLLKRSFFYFPIDTIFLAIVDPTVGSKREIIYLHVEGYGGVVAPNNGILSHLIDELNQKNINYTLNIIYLKNFSNKSNTFHGRDMFAPIVASLINSDNKIELLEFNNENLIKFDTLPLKIDSNITEIETSIAYIDRFGNCYINITLNELNRLKFVIYKDRKIEFLKYYSQTDIGKELSLINSDGYLELSINSGNFAKRYNLNISDKVKLYFEYQ